MYVGVCGCGSVSVCGRFMDASSPLWDVGVGGVGMLVYRYKMSGEASHQILMVVWN